MIKSSRREVILKMGAWPLLWPLLRQGRAHAQPATPKRVLVFFSPNGPIMERGPATGTETNFQIHDWWKPLERHKAEGLFFAGMMQAGVPFGNHNEFGHQSGGTGALTARTTEGTNNATGPSLDQFIGRELQKKGIVTPKRSLLWGLHDVIGNWGPWYEDAGKPVTPQSDPYKALADIVPSLKGPMGGNPVVDKQLLRRKYVLDAVYKDCKELTSGLGAEGKTLLDFHCTNIDSVSQSVAKSLENAMTPTKVDCSAPSKPNTMLAPDAAFESSDVRDDVSNAFAEMATLAFACDVTRVIGFSFGQTAERFGLPKSYGVPNAAKVDSGDDGPQHHAWTHTYDNGADKRKALKTFYTWYAETVAKFIDKLKSTKDATGKPLMDSTIVLWTSELGHDTSNQSLDPHPNQNIPVLTFGNGGGAWKTNRFYNGSGGDKDALALHALFVSIIQHTGLTNINSFGNQGTDPLEWVKG